MIKYLLLPQLSVALLREPDGCALDGAAARHDEGGGQPRAGHERQQGLHLFVCI